jgi:hypothetical protein
VAGSVVCLALVLVVSWRAQIPNRNDESYLESLSVTDVVSSLLSTAPESAFAVVRQSLDPNNWGGAFWVAPLLMAVGWRGLAKPPAIASLGWIGVHCGLAFSAYALAPDVSLVAVTWNRFVVQMLVPLMVVVATCGEAVLLRAGWHLEHGDRQG